MLSALIDRTAAATPLRAAVVWGQVRLSYADLAQRTWRCAAGLRAAGVGPGDVIGLLLPNRPEFVIAFFAAARLGAIVAPASVQATQAELKRLMMDALPKALICDPARERDARTVAAAMAPAPAVFVTDRAAADGFDALGSGAAAAADVGLPDSRALYLYTSGSTDSFKRICCTQSNLWFEAENFIATTGQTAEDGILCAVPLHHSYGLGNGLLDAAYAGATLILEADTEAPFAARAERLCALLRAERPRIFLGVPFQYDVLSASAANVADAFTDVRLCVSSGDALRRRTFDAFRARTRQPIRSLYGSTEAGSIAMDAGPAECVRFGDLGRPLANVVIESRGKLGELWVKSPTLPPGGYDNRPELNPLIFQDGFYNTGDLGQIDSQGRLSITGRKQSFVDVGGHKVDLAEVEETLLSHPAVREAAVVGVEVPDLGGVLKAVLAADETCREADILHHCRSRLAGFKTPRLIEFRETLPRSPLGKVLKAELKETSDWLADVRSARDIPPGTRARRSDWLARRIQEQVAVVLTLPPTDIPRGAPFQSLGLDSLRAVELQERLSRMSGVALSITTLWSHPSIDAYAGFLLDAMLGPAAHETRPPDDGMTGDDPLSAASDEEIAALLARELDLDPEQT
jgi:long-chain acyl-CoA synthetase